jgi:hypothetical protein
MQKVLQGVFRVRNVFIFGFFDNLYRKFVRVEQSVQNCPCFDQNRKRQKSPIGIQVTGDTQIGIMVDKINQNVVSWCQGETLIGHEGSVGLSVCKVHISATR